MVAISIITPTLNAEHFLTECLASVDAQQVDGIEHLIVDGGSTDRTQELVRQSRAKWISCPGQRQAAAINAGLRLAHGEIVAWLNADDLYAPGSLRLVMDRFAANPELDVVFGQCDVIDDSGKLLWRERPGPDAFRHLLERGNALAQPAVFLRKRVFDELGYLDESLEFAMDYEMWLRVQDRRMSYMPRVLAMFRWHKASKTANNLTANWKELLVIVRRYGGGWTPPLAWSFAKARLTVVRQRATDRLRNVR